MAKPSYRVTMRSEIVSVSNLFAFPLLDGGHLPAIRANVAKPHQSYAERYLRADPDDFCILLAR